VTAEYAIEKPLLEDMEMRFAPMEKEFRDILAERDGYYVAEVNLTWKQKDRLYAARHIQAWFRAFRIRKGLKVKAKKLEKKRLRDAKKNARKARRQKRLDRKAEKEAEKEAAKEAARLKASGEEVPIEGAVATLEGEATPGDVTATPEGGEVVPAEGSEVAPVDVEAGHGVVSEEVPPAKEEVVVLEDKSGGEETEEEEEVQEEPVLI